MKKMIPSVATAISIMSGHIVFVMRESAVSVMLTNQSTFKTIVVPAPRTSSNESRRMISTNIKQKILENTISNQ